MKERERGLRSNQGIMFAVTYSIRRAIIQGRQKFEIRRKIRNNRLPGYFGPLITSRQFILASPLVFAAPSLDASESTWIQSPLAYVTYANPC